MELGRLKQKASWFTVGFVFGCIFIIILLLWISVRAEQKAQSLISISEEYDYYMKN